VSEVVVNKFLRKWGQFPDLAVKDAISRTFPDLYALTPPINLGLLAEMRDVKTIRSVDLSFDGMISVHETGGYAIELNKSQPTRRQRFTCAHEIGHTFFLELESDELRPRMRVVDTNVELRTGSEEKLCNSIAAEILLPQIPFRRVVKEFGVCVANILSMAELFHTSIQATARRLVECSRFKLAIALLEYNSDAELFATKWSVSSPSVKARKSAISISKTDPAFHIFSQLNDRYRGRKWLSIGGGFDDYFVDAIVLKRTKPKQVLTLFVLENNAEQLITTPLSPTNDLQISLFDL